MTAAHYWSSPSGPPGPPQQWHHLQQPEKSPRRRPFGNWLPVICYVAASILILGLGWAFDGFNSGGARQPAEYRAPFYGAVIALSQTPAITYQTPANAGGVSIDASVTEGGEIEGTFAVGGESFGLLVVGGKTYIKPPTSLLGQYVSSGEDASLLAGRWMTDTDVSGQLGDVTSTLPTPSALAQQFLSALNESATVWPTSGSKATKVDGVQAWGAKTPSGELYVSADMPYRVLKLVPTVSASASGTSSSAASAAVEGGTFGALPAAAVTDLRGLNTELASFRKTAYPRTDTVVQAASFLQVSGATALQDAPVTMSPSESGSDLSKVTAPFQQYFKQLPLTIDEKLTSSTAGDGEKPQCSSGGCTEAERITNTETSTDPSVQVAGGNEQAQMDVTFTVDGAAAGSCATEIEIPVNGSGEAECADPGAGPVFAEQEQIKKAQAQAQSQAENGASVPYEVDFEAEVAITALATVDVAVLTQNFNQEQQQDAQSPDPYAVDTSPGAQPSGDASASASGESSTQPSTGPSSQPSSEPSASGQEQPSSQPTSQSTSQTTSEPSYQTPDGTIYPQSSNPYEPVLNSTYSTVATLPQTTSQPGTTTITTPGQAAPVQVAPDSQPTSASSKDACANYRAPGAHGTGGYSSWYVDTIDDATDAVEAGYACLSGAVNLGDNGTSDAVGSPAARAKAAAVGIVTGTVQNCHVIGRLLGGGKGPDNMTPCWQRINVSNMETYERMVSGAKPTTRDQGLLFTEIPVYKYANSTIPEAYRLTAEIINSSGATIRILAPSNFTNAQSFPGVGSINLGF